MILHRTNHPPAARYRGRPLFSYWFRYLDHIWGVSAVKYDGAREQWEVVHAGTMGTVRDDYGSLRQLRRQVREDCEVFLRDLEAEDA